MIKEAIAEGATLEEATEKAKAELNASFDDDVQFEVLANPKKKTLGLFGGSLAKVRVYIEVPDPVEKKPRRKNDNNKKTKQEKPQTAKAPKAEVKAEEKQAEPEVPAVPADQIEKDSPTGRAIAYLESILANLNVGEVKILAAVNGNSARIILEGDDLGIIIGRRGDTLDALQYLASLAASSSGGFFRISLDTGNYREKREQTLKSLARRMSNQVLRTGRSRTLEPMNPYERRIIHTEVQLISGVESNSTGEGLGRRVVISPVGGARRDDRSRGGRRSSGRPQQKTVVPAIDREPKKDATNLPLYGKID